MEITRNTRMDKLSTCNTGIQHLYISPEAGSKYREVFSKHDLEETQYTAYVTAIGDVVLGFYPISELTNLFVANAGIEQDTARNLTADLVDFLSPVITSSTSPQPDRGDVTPQFIPVDTANASTQVSNPKQVAVPQEEEAAQPIVEPVRTMQHDMDKIQGYGAYRKMYPDSAIPDVESQQPQSKEPVVQATSQDEVLKRPPLAGTPSYDQPPQQ